MKSKPFRCFICGETCAHENFSVSEMNFGFKDNFQYDKCSFCGTLKLITIPKDISKYYPPNYYAHIISKPSKFETFLKRKRAKAALGKTNIIGKILIKLYGIPPFIRWIEGLNLNFHDPILDVGCGSGFLLKDMSNVGFTNLTGIDPYLNENTSREGKYHLLKKSIHQIAGEYKLIMYNHSLEHIIDPLSELQKVKSLLARDGIALIRIPLIDSYAWEKYKINWVQIDAPRHLFIPSRKAMKILFTRVGFDLFNIVYDSNEFQFWGSEQYLKEIPLESEKSYQKNPKYSIFNGREIKKFKHHARILNQDQNGDQACFYIKKI